jgi:hypothetical protein
MSLPANPANKPDTNTDATKRRRIPMSVPQRRLETPEIPGYHLYWFVDRNVERALQAGYEMVKKQELSLNQHGVATDKSISGSADLGSNIKLVAGTSETGGAEYLNLMKIPLAWWQEDQKVLEERNAQVLSAVFKDEQVGGSRSAADQGTSYVKKALFQRPKRVAR